MDYGILIFLYGVGIVLFAVGWDKEDETTVYVGHTMIGFASVLAIGMGLGFGVPALWIAAAAVFIVNFGVLANRIRHS